jgi:hypothetical protein
MFTLYIFFGLIWLVIAVLLSFWVYEDAESRGMDGILWIIVVLLTGILGLVIYLAVRSEKGKALERVQRVCLRCGRVLEEKFRYCPYCGKEQE